ncbi:MAG: hypothetical protein KIB53_11875 [Paraclostridium bifermentans]|uniref:S41 family peptidase n=1 Tax=Paraclostridium bifermentans TaxID=1490 RepID=UPI00241C2A06|nr:S41 family peptidase [Paraclostridium bifermentans]MBS5954512.1 hypothetical protein [Paraclostridium bifermentans]
MKKILCIIVFSLTIFLLSGCNSLLTEKRVLNNEKWIEDIKYLDANLRKEHPNIFKYVEEDKWNQSIESLIADIPKLSDSSIILKTSQIIASLGDGHTFINPLDLITPFGQEHEVYWYKNFEEDEILYFRLNKFTTNFHLFKDKKPDKKPPDFREVQKSLISEINKHNYSKFIIDLRENRGGDVNILNAVVDMIKFQTDLKGEDIYILTGKESASASVTLAWKLQGTLGSTVVGETTGGNVNLFTTCNQSLQLPNSNLNIYYPFKESIYKKGYIGGVNPDFEVRQNYSDYLNGIDTCYEFVKNVNNNYF